ncbi:general substrate transporter [Mycena olivaceomarginata]|nr:general substrate transporter [Mycena olivaceomarginata]
MPLSPKVFTWLCGLFASLGSIIFGYDLGVIAGVTPAADFQRVMGPRWGNTNLQGLVVSIFVAILIPLSSFFGMIPVAYAADFFGRRITIQIGAAIYILGGAIQTGAQNMDMMLAGRFFAGFGVGIMSDLAPLYQAEIAHPSIRGRLTTLQQVSFAPSLKFMLGIGGLTGHPSEWRVPLGIQIVPALPLISFMLLLPESPRWLAEKGRVAEAQQALARLHANGNTEDPFVLSQIKDIQADISKSRDLGEASWGELFHVPSNFRRLSLGFVESLILNWRLLSLNRYILQFSVQMTGTLNLPAMGFSSTRILLFQSVNSIIALIGEAACVIWIDATGRRGPMIIGNIASGLSFVVGSILMARYPGTVNNTWIFNFFFSACIGPLSWAYPAEIYSTRTRAKATAITSSGSWISNFFIAQVTSPAFTNIGWKYYLVFAICGHTKFETTGRPSGRCNAPLFVPGTPYAKVGDRLAAERELRQGTFRPGDLTEHNTHGHDEEDTKGSTEKIE